MNFASRESWFTRLTSRLLPATKSDVKKTDKLIMALKDDLTAAVDKLIAKNDAILALLANVQSGAISPADIQTEIDKLNAESAKDDAANPPAAV